MHIKFANLWYNQSNYEQTLTIKIYLRMILDKVCLKQQHLFVYLVFNSGVHVQIGDFYRNVCHAIYEQHFN